MCLTIEDGLLSVLTILSFECDPTGFADIMSINGLIPNEVKDDVHRLYKTGKLTDHHLRCRILQAVKDFISTNERENVQHVFIVMIRYFYMFIGSVIKSMKVYLCKLVCVRGKGMGLIYNVYSTTSTNSTSISIS